MRQTDIHISKGVNKSIHNAVEKMEPIEGYQLGIKLGNMIKELLPFMKAWRPGTVKSRKKPSNLKIHQKRQESPSSANRLS